MATLTIRNLDSAVKASLRVRAAQHGVSMEEEARRILGDAASAAQDAVTPPPGARSDLHPAPGVSTEVAHSATGSAPHPAAAAHPDGLGTPPWLEALLSLEPVDDVPLDIPPRTHDAPA